MVGIEGGRCVSRFIDCEHGNGGSGGPRNDRSTKPARGELLYVRRFNSFKLIPRSSLSFSIVGSDLFFLIMVLGFKRSHRSTVVRPAISAAVLVVLVEVVVRLLPPAAAVSPSGCTIIVAAEH